MTHEETGDSVCVSRCARPLRGDTSLPGRQRRHLVRAAYEYVYPRSADLNAMAAWATVKSQPSGRLVVLCAVFALTMLVHPGAASAQDGEPGMLSTEVSSILTTELLARPGGVVDGNEIHYADGLTFVAVEAGTLSLSECPSGKFCGWAQANFSGSFYSTSGSGLTKTLSWTARSYANKRSEGSRLYNSAGSASTCFAPGRTRATIKSTYYSPSKVYLSTSTSC